MPLGLQPHALLTRAWAALVLASWGGIGEALVAGPFLLVMIPLIFVLLRRDRGVLQLYVAGLVMSAATIYAFPAALPGAYFRYCVPALLAPALAGVDLALRWPPAGRRAGWAIAWGAAAVLVCGIWPAGDPLENLRNGMTAARASLLPWDGPSLPPLRGHYARMQQAVPAGKTVASVLDFPNLLDFGRNPIDCVDFPGGASRTGVWPFGQGAEALARFMAAQGVDYVAYCDFHQAIGLYRYDTWAVELHEDRAAGRFLDMMDTVAALPTVRPLVYDHEGYRVVRVRD